MKETEKQKIRQKIRDLRVEANRLERELGEQESKKYDYLVGKCLKVSATSYELIKEIDGVYRDVLNYDCVQVFIDEWDASVSNIAHGEIHVDSIERSIIPKEKFLEYFDKAVGIMREID